MSMISASSIMTESTTVATEPTKKEKPNTPTDEAVEQLSSGGSEETDGSQFIVTPQIDSLTIPVRLIPNE